MKISPTINACLWGCLALVALAGIPVTILKAGFMGPIPMFGSLLVGVLIAKSAYSQWREQQIKVDFVKVFPLIAAGGAVAMVLGHFQRIGL